MEDLRIARAEARLKRAQMQLNNAQLRVKRTAYRLGTLRWQADQLRLAQEARQRVMAWIAEGLAAKVIAERLDDELGWRRPVETIRKMMQRLRREQASANN